MIEPLGSVQTVARALDILAKQPDTRVSYASLATQLGMEKKNLQGILSTFTRTMHQRYKRRKWPMTWVEALTTEPGLKSEFFCTTTATVAER
jgi:AraC-like DNA-binding protein